MEGDPIELREVIANRKLLPLPWLKSEITTSRWLEFSQLQSVVTGETRFISSFFLVRSYQKITRTWQGRCLKRGVFSVEKSVLVASDLLGGAALSSVAPAGSQVVVFPRPLDLENDFRPASRRTGDRISVLGVGTSGLPAAGAKEGAATLEMALEQGINYFDLATADSACFPIFGAAPAGGGQAGLY